MDSRFRGNDRVRRFTHLLSPVICVPRQSPPLLYHLAFRRTYFFCHLLAIFSIVIFGPRCRGTHQQRDRRHIQKPPGTRTRHSHGGLCGEQAVSNRYHRRIGCSDRRDFIHTRPHGAPATIGQESLYHRVRSIGHNFHLSVDPIAHPTRQI